MGGLNNFEHNRTSNNKTDDIASYSVLEKKKKKKIHPNYSVSFSLINQEKGN